MSEALPGHLAQLLVGLEERGFRVRESQDFPARNSRYIELENTEASPRRRVRLTCDLGLWGVEVEVGGEFFPEYDAAQAIEAAPHSARARSHEERKRYTLYAVDALAGEGVDEAVIRDRLLAYRAEYNARFEQRDRPT